MYIRGGFSKEELRDLLISVLVYTVAFSIYGLRNPRLAEYLPVYLIVLASFLVAIFAFLLHEMAHRFTAMHDGGSAVYKMWPIGAMLALATSVLGFIFAAVGAVYIQGLYDNEKIGRASLAGPATNVGLGIIFFAAAILSPNFQIALMLSFISSLNLYMGVFNLLPIPPLDGYKVYLWSKEYYIVSIAVSLFLLIYLGYVI